MEMDVVSPQAGTVAEIPVSEGQQVAAGATLVVLT